jgi:sulfopyruvate decarboxylase subunit beta
VKRFDCLKLLASWIDEEVLTVTSLSTTAREWSPLWKRGPNFYGLNLGLCFPFALGLSLSFPRRKVIALDSDGSLLLDTSSLITAADVNPPNLLAIVFDNQSYGRMGPTATSRVADLEKMARGAGIKLTGTLHTLEDFTTSVKKALESSELSFFVAKVERGTEPIENNYMRFDGRPVRDAFVEALRRYPDYRG